MRLLQVLICCLTVTAGSALAQSSDEATEELRVQSLGLKADTATLTQFFQFRTQTEVAPARLRELLTNLRSAEPPVATAASQELIGLGPLAVNALRTALSDPDGSPATLRARRCLEALTGPEAGDLPTLAARVLVRQSPESAAAVLLGYLPFSEHEQGMEEIRELLLDLGRRSEDRLASLVLETLRDPSPVRRGIAVEMLLAQGKASRESLKSLLADPSPTVRLRVAQALAAAKDQQAISELIVLLGELPFKLGREVEDYLSNVAGDQAPNLILAADEASRQKAREVWADWWVKSEKPGLLDEFRRRTMTEEAREKTAGLIRNLGSETFKVREQAAQQLREMGVLVLPLLRKASTEDVDPEIKKRARETLLEIEKNQAAPLNPVSVRLVAFRKPEGAAQVLLNYIPFADDPSLLVEVQSTLNSLAYVRGQPEPVLVRALDDALPLRRAAAAEALARPSAPKDLLAAVRNLLQDRDPLVRSRVALSLAGTKDKTAVPILIASLAEVPLEQAFVIEDYLTRVAGDSAPVGDLGSDAAGRTKRREAWASWWKTQGEQVRLVSLSEANERERVLGYTLLISPNMSRIAEIDRAGKIRWEIQNLSNVWDAQLISRNRVLVLESGAMRITERNLRGEVLWEATYQNIWPVGCQRLPNGNTLLTSNQRLVEINRSGKEVFAYDRPQGDILAARRLRDGQTIFVSSNSSVHRLDQQGREIKTWAIQPPTNQGIHILPNGNVLFPQQYNNRVFEYDTNGKMVWSATVQQPASAQRLGNGNTLITMANPFQVIELDRGGKEVWKVALPFQALRAYRR